MAMSEEARRAQAILNSRAYLVAGRIAAGLNKQTKHIFKSYAQRVIDAAENTLEREFLGMGTDAGTAQADRVRELEDQLAQQAQLIQEQSMQLTGQSAELEAQRRVDDEIQEQIEQARSEQDALRAEFEAMKREAQTPSRPAPFPPASPTGGGGDGDTDANAAMPSVVPVPTARAFMLGIGGRDVPVGHHGRVVTQDIIAGLAGDQGPLSYEDYDARVLGAMGVVVQRIRGLVRSSLNKIEHPRDILDADNADVGTLFLELVVIELSLAENLQPTRPNLQITYDRNMERKRHLINALGNFEFRRGDRGKPVITRAKPEGTPVMPLIKYQF